MICTTEIGVHYSFFSTIASSARVVVLRGDSFPVDATAPFSSSWAVFRGAGKTVGTGSVVAEPRSFLGTYTS